MATVKLKNITSGMAKVGALVKVHPTDKSAFQYITDLSTLSVIGTIAQTASPGALCTINLINEGSGTVVPVNPYEGHLIVSPFPPAAPKVNDIWIEITST
jgi:hypothetical protein